MQQRPATSDRGAVVVTGAHRSGTTLLGDIVAQATGTWTVWEPFNQHWGLREVRSAYPYLRSGDAAAPAVTSLQRYLGTGRGLWSAKPRSRVDPTAGVRAGVKTVRRHLLWRRHSGDIPVVKDPFVMLAMAALQPAVTDRPIIVAVRHPCSWVASLRRMGWPAGPELNALLRQEELYAEHLSAMLARRDWTAAGDLEAGAIAWACLYHMVNVQARGGVRLLVVPLESYGREPLATLDLLYRTLGLPAPADLSSVAERYSGADKAVTPQATTKHLLQRDSRTLNEAWKGKLTAAEVSRVRAVTEPVFATIYDDWETAGAPVGVVPGSGAPAERG